MRERHKSKYSIGLTISPSLRCCELVPRGDYVAQRYISTYATRLYASVMILGVIRSWVDVEC